MYSRINLPQSNTELFTLHTEIIIGSGKKVKGKVFYGQEPPCGESTTTECGVNYQLLAVY